MENIQAFAETFRSFMDSVVAAAPPKKSLLAEKLRAFMGDGVAQFPVLSYEAEGYEHPSMQRALEEMMEAARERGDAVEVLGLGSAQFQYSSPRIADIFNDEGDVKEASAIYRTFLLPGGETIGCLSMGLVLIGGARPVMLLVEGPDEQRHKYAVAVQVLAGEREHAELVLRELRRRMHDRDVYRGHSLIVTSTPYRGTSVRFHPIPRILREDLILNEETLARIERQTIAFADNSAVLAAAGRHLKRGVLLYGPPGTGKTLSAMYLAARMSGRTVLLTAGLSHGSLASVCEFARRLQPATVIMEDVDLVAEHRERQSECSMPLLFEMLNQMDGLNEDADVLFILTTNRPEALEPALAARPGRIDQAIEVPLPDAACRERLIELYAKGLTLRVASVTPWVERTKGASAAFIRELLRRAALLAILDKGEAVVEDRELDESMRELTLAKSLTGRFLGFSSP